MKNGKGKLLSLLLGAVMTISMIPMAVFAAETAPFNVSLADTAYLTSDIDGSVDITKVASDKGAGSGTVSWDAASKTVTMDNVIWEDKTPGGTWFLAFATYDEKNYGDAVKVVFKGTNKVIGSFLYSAGVDVQITAYDNTASISIDTSSGNAIWTHSATMTFGKGNYSIKHADTEKPAVVATDGGGINITDGANMDVRSVYGTFDSEAPICITGKAKVTASGDSYAMWSGQGVKIDGGADVTCNSANGNGIESDKDIIVSGAGTKLTATAKKRALSALNDITLNNADVKAKSTGGSKAIRSKNGTVSVDGKTVSQDSISSDYPAKGVDTEIVVGGHVYDFNKNRDKDTLPGTPKNASFSWDATSKTLTLENMDWTKYTMSHYIQIKAPADATVTIKLVGNTNISNDIPNFNTIELYGGGNFIIDNQGTFVGKGSQDHNVVYCEGNLTLKGGDFELTSNNYPALYSTKSITMQDTATKIKADGNGIYAEQDIIISGTGSNITVDSKMTSLSGNSVTISDAEVDLHSVSSAAIWGREENIVLNSAKLKAKNDDSSQWLLCTPKKIIVNGKECVNQDFNDSFYVSPANYEKVTTAISNIPKDLSKYTEDSVNALNAAQKAVDYSKGYDEQETVDNYAKAINEAVAALKCKHSPKKISGQEPTCTEAGWKDYYQCEHCSKFFEDEACTVEITSLEKWKAKDGNGYRPALGHDWGEPEWNWSTDSTTATVKFTCKRDAKHTETPEVTMSHKTTEPTCTTAGETVYTATVTFNGKTYTDTKTVSIPAIDHNLGVVWKWIKTAIEKLVMFVVILLKNLPIPCVIGCR